MEINKKYNPYFILLIIFFIVNVTTEIIFFKAYYRDKKYEYWRDAYIESETKRKLLKKEFDMCGDLITAQDYGICAVYYKQIEYLKEFIATNEKTNIEIDRRLY